MFLNYRNKKSTETIIKNDNDGFLEKINGAVSSNKLILGDNFKVLKSLIYNFNLQSSVDLVYIDPPFSTNSHFKIGTDRTSTISSSASDETA
jgi:adenine-specific DNA-methyltransferase